MTKRKVSNGVRAVVLRAAGINCDMETEYALESAGAQAERVHINRIIKDKSALDEYQILVFPGGFSYGDDVAAGKILANQVIHHLAEAVRKFIDDGKLVLGICNGFQVLVKAGVLPGSKSNLATEDTENTGKNKKDTRHKTPDQRPATSNSTGHLTVERRATDLVTITYNDSGKFEDRWVYLAPQTERCIFIEQGRQIYLPIAHGEGKVVTKDEATLEKLKSEGYVAFKYVDKDGKEGDYPINPNGSTGSIAGLTDTTGRVLGLMPHPERHVRFTQHPHWSRLRVQGTRDEEQGTRDGDGMAMFVNAVKFIQENF
jgi:phosphoribosylformylglycinamidine synthase